MSEIPPAPSPKKEIIVPRDEPPAEDFADDPPEAEPHYGEAKLWLIARDPHCLFAYWEFRPEEHPHAGGDGRTRLFLRIFSEGGEVESTTDIAAEKGNAFVPVANSDRGYFAEVGFFAGQIWCFLARSGIARTPPALAEKTFPPQFATIPAQVALSTWRELLAPAALPDESPAATAARLQSDARQHDLQPLDRMHLLAEILGTNDPAPASPPVQSPTLRQKVRRKLAATAGAATPGAEISLPARAPSPASSGSQFR